MVAGSGRACKARRRRSLGGLVFKAFASLNSRLESNKANKRTGFEPLNPTSREERPVKGAGGGARQLVEQLKCGYSKVVRCWKWPGLRYRTGQITVLIMQKKRATYKARRQRCQTARRAPWPSSSSLLIPSLELSVASIYEP